MNGLMRRHAGLKCFGWQKETRRPASTAGDGLTLRFRQIAQLRPDLVNLHQPFEFVRVIQAGDSVNGA